MKKAKIGQRIKVNAFSAKEDGFINEGYMDRSAEDYENLQSLKYPRFVEVVSIKQGQRGCPIVKTNDVECCITHFKPCGKWEIRFKEWIEAIEKYREQAF